MRRPILDRPRGRTPPKIGQHPPFSGPQWGFRLLGRAIPYNGTRLVQTMGGPENQMQPYSWIAPHAACQEHCWEDVENGSRTGGD